MSLVQNRQEAEAHQLYEANAAETTGSGLNYTGWGDTWKEPKGYNADQFIRRLHRNRYDPLDR